MNALHALLVLSCLQQCKLAEYQCRIAEYNARVQEIAAIEQAF
ncbi:MAG TPA: hypothetical protein VGD78_15065 [Chthoniobacterales bacterium]